MKKFIVLAAVLVAITGGVIVAVQKDSPPDSSMKGMDMNSSAPDVAKAVQTDAVNIQNFSFSPQVITIKKGTKVTWTNQDSVAHSVVEKDGKTGPHSQSLSKGESYSFTYDQVGTFKYICGIHPDMKATVIVTD